MDLLHKTSSRLLSLLSLLQTHRDWSGEDLAERLSITSRTVRGDIDRLRELGYPITTVKGPAGGYRLEAGAHLPPMLFDDDRAVALAVALPTAATGTSLGPRPLFLGLDKCAAAGVVTSFRTAGTHLVTAVHSGDRVYQDNGANPETTTVTVSP